MLIRSKLGAISFALTVAAGAAHSQPEQAKSQDAPSAGRVAYARHAKYPKLDIVTPAEAALMAPGGGSAWVPDGKKIAETFELQDPGNRLAAELAQFIAESQGMELINDPIDPNPDDKKVAASLGKQRAAKYVVYTQSLSVTAVYYSFDWAHYHLNYNGIVWIIDAESGKVVYHHGCLVTPKRTANQPRLAELLQDRGELLTKMADESTHLCLEWMKADIPKVLG
jgi:hypothetical protein